MRAALLSSLESQHIRILQSQPLSVQTLLPDRRKETKMVLIRVLFLTPSAYYTSTGQEIRPELVILSPLLAP